MKIIFRALALATTLLASLAATVPVASPASADSTTTSPSRIAPFAIKAFHPGHTSAEGVRDSGELIELVALEPTTFTSLAGLSIDYTNKNGNRSNIVRFPEGSGMSGEHILLRLARSPEASEADLTYTTNISASDGVLELSYQGALVERFCWGSIDSTCLANFSKTPLSLIIQDLSTGIFFHNENYTPHYDSLNPTYIPPPPSISPDESLPAQCLGLQFSELLSYYEDSQSEQFIEFYNSTEEPITLDGCAIRYKKKLYYLSGIVPPAAYHTRSVNDFTLTKDPTSSNLLELIDVNTATIDTLEYFHGQKKSTSYAFFGYLVNGASDWRITYQPTPGAPNIYQQYRTCPAGKVINETTGNCVKATTLENALTDCPAGKYRNPITGRCKSYTSQTITECKPGYERNPETNRCRKIKDNTGASFALLPQTAEERSRFVAIGAVALIVVLGLSYVVFQFRHEIKKGIKKIFSRWLRK